MRLELRRSLVASVAAATPRDVCGPLAAAIVRPSTVLARFWLRDAADGLQLVASTGFPTGGGTYSRTDGEFSRIAGSQGKIGQIAATRQPLIVRGVRGDEDWLANPGWISRQGVRAFVGLPLIASDQVLGVMAIFERAMLSDETIEELRFIADFAATRLWDLAMRAASGEDAQRATPAPPASPSVMTRDELRAREKANIEAALAATRGKVFGDDGAARLLGMRPTTLASRIKSLGVTRERPPTATT